MLRRQLVTFGMVAMSAIVALAGAAPGVVAAQSLAHAAPGAAMVPNNAPSYVDNRSDAVDLLISYFNAIDRQEYDRAYTYWEPNSSVGTFAQFQAGYANTQAVVITTGQVGVSAGAGQRYFVVPVTLQATTTGGPQTFVGCYVTHLALPEL